MDGLFSVYHVRWVNSSRIWYLRLNGVGKIDDERMVASREHVLLGVQMALIAFVLSKEFCLQLNFHGVVLLCRCLAYVYHPPETPLS